MFAHKVVKQSSNNLPNFQMLSKVQKFGNTGNTLCIVHGETHAEKAGVPAGCTW